jgi:hypothetical protein
VSALRSVLAPLATSRSTFLHPARVSWRTWASTLCPSVRRVVPGEAHPAHHLISLDVGQHEVEEHDVVLVMAGKPNQGHDRPAEDVNGVSPLSRRGHDSGSMRGAKRREWIANAPAPYSPGRRPAIWARAKIAYSRLELGFPSGPAGAPIYLQCSPAKAGSHFR